MSTANRPAETASIYFAQPYSPDAVGFYFTDLSDYDAKASAAVDRYGVPVEEFELQYIDGEHANLFNALRVSQAGLSAWFELLDELGDDPDRYLIACHLAGDGYNLEELSDRWDDYTVYHGTTEDYAREMVEDCYEIPENLAYYLDYERLGRDMALEGTVIEIAHDLLLIGR